VEVYAALLALPDSATEHKDSLVVKLTKVLDLGPKLLPRTDEVAPHIIRMAEPGSAARLRSIGDHELDFRVRPSCREVFAAFRRRVHRAHEVEVGGHGYFSRPTALRASAWSG
jgi:hypothetical protein